MKPKGNHRAYICMLLSKTGSGFKDLTSGTPFPKLSISGIMIIVWLQVSQVHVTSVLYVNLHSYKRIGVALQATVDTLYEK